MDSKAVQASYNSDDTLRTICRYESVGISFVDSNSVSATDYQYFTNIRVFGDSTQYGSRQVNQKLRPDVAAANASEQSTYSDGVYWYVFEVTLPQAVNDIRVDLVNGNSSSGDVLASDAVRLSYVAKTLEYTWDFRNRLTSVSIDDEIGTTSKIMHYRYDALDRRIAKGNQLASGQGPIEWENYVWDGDQVELHLDNQNAVVQRNLWAQAVDQLLAYEVTAGEVSTRIIWPLADHQGTVRDTYGKEGTAYQKLNTINYDGFGRPTNDQYEVDYLYAGQHYDWETGLQYSRARYYDPQARVFLSQDPMSFAAGDTNLYRRVGNSPINAVDPNGLWSVMDVFWGGLQALGGALQFAAGVSIVGASAPLIATPGVLVGVAGVAYGSATTFKGADNFVHGLGRIVGLSDGTTWTEQIATAATGSETAGKAIDIASDFLGFNPFNFGTKMVTASVTVPARMAPSVVRGAGKFGRYADDLARLPGYWGWAEKSFEFGVPAIQGLKTARELMTAQHLGSIITGSAKGLEVIFANGGSLTEDDAVEAGLRVRGRNLGQEQGREFRPDQLEIFEFDRNAPSYVRGWLQNERRRIETGRSDAARTPPGYVLGHGRSTPAREGFDYSNSRLQGADLNRLEERIRRQYESH